MIIKTIFKIKIHFFFYVVAFTSLITGFFKDFSIITIIILIHELGHIIGALIYKWNIEKIIILPFGGLTLFNEKINRPIKEELIIALLGPTLQIVVCSFFNNPLFLHYHYALLFFNLLPIFPLDGSRLFNLLLNSFLPFKLSHKLTLYCSFLLIILLPIVIITNFNLLFLLIIFFLIIKLCLEFQNHNNLFNKFLMERFLYDLKFQKQKIIKGSNLEKFHRDYYHLLYINNFYYSEEYILSKRFKRKIKTDEKKGGFV